MESIAPLSAPNIRFDLLTEGVKSRLGADNLLILSEMIYSASPEFYSLIPRPHGEILRLISLQIATPGTELANVYLLRAGKALLGLVAGVPLRDLNSAKETATLAIVRSLPRSGQTRFLSRLRQHGGSIEPFEEDGWYISRVAVAAGRCGNGIGKAVLARVLQERTSELVGLHVHEANTPALNLYRRLGFEFATDAVYAFRAMLRRAPITTSVLDDRGGWERRALDTPIQATVP